MAEIAQLVLKVTSEGAVLTAEQLRQLSGAAHGADDSFGKLAGRIAGFTTAADLAVRAGQAVVRGIKDMAVESVTLAASFEKSRMTWGVLVGDMDKGKRVFDDLYAFAAKTPLSFEGINQAATTLKAYGIATEELIPTMRMLGDVAMGDNGKLDGIARAFGQIQSTGRLMGQDLLQLINQGFNPLQIISAKTGESMVELKARMEKGGISAQEVAEAFKSATSEGGQFYGMMDKTAETISGKWSTAMDTFKSVLAELGDSFLPAIGAGLDYFNREVGKSIEILQARKAIETNTAIVQEFQNTPKWVSDMQTPEARAREVIRYHDALVALIEINKQYLEQEGLSAAQRSAALAQIQTGYRELEKVSREYGKATSGAMSGVARPWQEWEKEIDAELAIKLDEIDQKAKAAEALGRKYDRIAERDKAIDAAIDTLLGLDRSKVDDPFKPTDRSVQELRRQKSDYMPVIASNEYADLFDPDNMLESADAMARMREEGDGYVQVLRMQIQAEKELKEEQLARLREYEQAMRAVESALESAGKQAYVDSFKSIGEAMASGKDGAETWAGAMAELGLQLLNQLPLLLLQAGLKAVASGQWEIGLGLIAASGLVAIGAGAANYAVEEAKKNPTPNALGGAYSSRSLSAYSNGVYNSPQFFGWEGARTFAQGGVFAEAGPEAIMPLRRSASGRLGVEASVPSVNLSVVVVNETSRAVSAQTEETTGPSGEKQVRVILRDAVGGLIADGSLDRALATRDARVAGRKVS